MNDTEKLIAELREWWDREPLDLNNDTEQWGKDHALWEKEFNEILSRHAAPAMQEDGVRDKGKTYIIKLFHEKQAHTESFEYCAYDPSCGGKWCGSHSTEQIARTDKSELLSHQEVLEKRVWGVTPYNAICRFMEWQTKGYDNSFLKGPASVKPPKDCGYTLDNCPKKEEPLEILASKKDLHIQRFPIRNVGGESGGIWTVCVNSKRGTEFKAQRLPFNEAEAKARLFLEGLEDKK